MPNKIIIIGAGVIGASTALALLKDGHRVTLIDQDAPCSGASSGNAGAIVNGSCAPTAMPGIIFDVIRMIGQPLSPLTIRPSYFLKILPWLLRFVLQSRSSAVYKNATHLHGLTQHAVKSWRQLTGHTELSSLLRETGWLKVYETKKKFASTSKSRELLDEMGTNYEVLSAAQIHDLEPNLAPIYKQGYIQNDSLSIVDPQRLVEGMVDLFVSRGGTYQQFGVDVINIDNGKVNVRGSNGNLTTDKAVIAAGAWSGSFAQQLGDSIPLDTERGYHLMLPQSTADLLNRPVVNGEYSFVLSPMTEGLRMTSQVEFAGLSAEPDYSRVRSLLPAVKNMLPDVEVREQSVWMGCRPSLPDSLPVLGFSRQSNKVLYAFGHHHLGMTLGAISGLIIADLVAGRKPLVPVSPYRPDRFSKL